MSRLRRNKFHLSNKKNHNLNKKNLKEIMIKEPNTPTTQEKYFYKEAEKKN